MFQYFVLFYFLNFYYDTYTYFHAFLELVDNFLSKNLLQKVGKLKNYYEYDK